jgi:hypothetical protein
MALARRAIVITLLTVLLQFCFQRALFAAPPPPVQHFYVPLPEDQVYHALKSIYPSNQTCPAFGENVANPIITYISISVISEVSLH